MEHRTTLAFDFHPGPTLQSRQCTSVTGCRHWLEHVRSSCAVFGRNELLPLSLRYLSKEDLEFDYTCGSCRKTVLISASQCTHMFAFRSWHLKITVNLEFSRIGTILLTFRNLFLFHSQNEVQCHTCTLNWTLHSIWYWIKLMSFLRA